MIDSRDSRSNGIVAHISMRGLVEAERYVEGVDHVVTCPPAAALCDAPFGKREREVLWGEAFCVLDEQAGWAFGFARASGYTGYIEAKKLRPKASDPSHVVCNRATMALSEPDFKAVKAEHVPLSLGSLVSVIEVIGPWTRIHGDAHDLFVPNAHLRELSEVETDPVTVAVCLLGTPYVWGGNSAFGIDCSGLVQIGCVACGIDCPGDSDQQRERLGTTLPEGAAPRRGDLLFWKGHVGWVADDETLLHANAHHMAVAFEPLQEALTRIEGRGDGPLLRHARLGKHNPAL